MSSHNAYTSSAKGFLVITTTIGLVALFLGLFPFESTDFLKFLCYATLAVLAAFFRVSLPTITGTLTINFLFVLIGIVEFSLSEVLFIATSMTGLQCVLAQDRRPTLAKILFNVAVISIATIASYAVYGNPRFLEAGASTTVLLVTAAFVLYVMTTFPVSMAIALTEHRPIVRTWRECSLWSGPYYLAGAAVSILFTTTTRMLGWQMALLVMPVVYLITRSYQLYMGRLEDGRKHSEQMAELHLRTIEALALAIEAKDTTTHDHLQRVQVYAVEIAKELDLPFEQIEALRAAALLHDIGKLAVPEHIISKPGKLTPEEFEKMKIHPIVGAEIIDQARFPYPVAPIVRSHHEKWNGEGYPDGLVGEAIPVGARILSVVDCLDALATDRQYRRGLPLEEALAIIQKESGRSFDPTVVAILTEKCVELEQKATLRRPARVRLSTAIRVERGAAPAAGFEETNENMPRPAETRQPLDFLTSIASARQEVQALFELSQNLGSSLSLNETLSVLAHRLKRIVPYDSMAIYFARDGKLLPEFVTGENFRLFSALEIPIGQGLSGWVAENKQPILNGNPSVEPGYLNDPSKFSTLRSALAVPLQTDKRVVGVLALYAAARDSFTADHLRVLLAISAKLSHSIENAMKYELAETSAVTDFLTSLPNARSLFIQMDSELNRCRRTGAALEILVCDLNGFKHINDRFGHLEGNRVLKEFATLLRETCRDYDYVARMGGDEFVVLIPELPQAAIEQKIQHLSVLARQAGQAIVGEATLSVAIGSARFPVDGEDAERLIAVADQRMYQMKAAMKTAPEAAMPARRETQIAASPFVH
jgi:diguanylate cyclase (GGDEF)-like protein/putative nucleotidyltransferase with HDIG domain